ncbi:MAG: L,D-transpeptidase family protein [Gammaproteobacteria bacterium]|nr:L,D-transpeptidase family protein [Gammaproteobacteria bacterium]MDH3362879.1 L,D-transpeptidase family protein [Gammaproteobacteria bacterium]
MLRRLALLLLPLLALGGCATLDDFLAGIKKSHGRGAVAFKDRPIEEPIAPNAFLLTHPEQSVVGEPQVVFTRAEDTLSDLAREYGLGYDEIVSANPGIDPWTPGDNTPILLPTQYVLPNVPRKGLVLNIATKRLFYFPEPAAGESQEVLTYPIGIGRVGWETPLGSTEVVSKARDPHWWVPASVRREHAEMGNPLPAIVPPGPDNPLGSHVLKLEMPGYLIHGTNQPYGVGMRVSHGCVRLYPENIENLYSLVDIGEAVTIINEPYQMGQRDGFLYFEAHAPLKDDAVPAAERLQALFDAHADASGRPLNDHLQNHVRSLAELASGVPVSIAMYDADEFLARARVVRNTVEADPNAPTLIEIREMMDEVDDEEEELL